ncbi:hypothetical protein J3F83DRAFT_474836 [Trichoderma novae-zelandiae]
MLRHSSPYHTSSTLRVPPHLHRLQPVHNEYSPSVIRRNKPAQTTGTHSTSPVHNINSRRPKSPTARSDNQSALLKTIRTLIPQRTQNQQLLPHSHLPASSLQLHPFVITTNLQSPAEIQARSPHKIPNSTQLGTLYPVRYGIHYNGITKPTSTAPTKSHITGTNQANIVSIVVMLYNASYTTTYVARQPPPDPPSRHASSSLNSQASSKNRKGIGAVTRRDSSKQLKCEKRKASANPVVTGPNSPTPLLSTQFVHGPRTIHPACPYAPAAHC